MKQKTIVTSKVEMLVVDLPVDAKNVRVGAFDNIYFDSKSQGWDGYDLIETPEGNWKHLGKATELTEEDWNGIVDYNECPDPFLGKIKFYQKYPDSLNDNFVNTATESGLSLLKANGVVLENEFGDEPKLQETVPQHMLDKGYGSNDYVDQLYDGHQWQEAESKVWNNAHLFIKLK